MKSSVFHVKTMVSGLTMRKEKVKAGKLPPHLWSESDEADLRRWKKKAAHLRLK